MKKMLISVLAAAVLASACTCPAAARETSFFNTFPQEVPASALVRSSPNDAAFTAAADKLEAAVKAGTATDGEFAALLTALKDEYDRLQTGIDACILDYYRDPDSCSADYSVSMNIQTEAGNRFTMLLQITLASKYKDVVRSTLGDKAADDALKKTVDTQAQLDLLSQCAALVNRYWTGVRVDYTAELAGKSYTRSQLVKACDAGSLTYDQYLDGTRQIEKAKNAAVAPIFQQLVKLHNQYAVSKGWKNYAEYAYANEFKRDFTTQEAQSFESYVKKYVVPVREQYRQILYANGELGEERLGALDKLTQQQVLDLVRPHMNDVSSEYAKLFDYMTRNSLCDIGSSATKLSAGFTVDIPQYHSAYIFSDPDGSWNDVRTLVHEFGHFAQLCMDRNVISCYDVAEIDSQGLEAMYTSFADSLAGAGGGDAWRAQTADELLSSVLDGCLHDEFQQKVYEADGSMSVDDMNRLYRTLGEEYGVHFIKGSDMAYGWVDVNHDFEAPFYYLSYATSAAAALELLNMSEDSFAAADDKYLQLEADSGDYSYKALMNKEGLPSVFEEKSVASLADGALRYLEKEAADVPDYTDISGHWFESGAKLISAESLMRGSGTGFDPDGTMTRAMFVTVLSRALGGEKVSEAAFSDVSDASAWYYDAVNWAAKQGYVEGADGEFRPDAPITRQDMAVILMRAVGSSEAQADESVLSAYGDSASIADYARGAVAEATQDGLMQGSGSGFDPTGATTRAQAGQVFIRLNEQLVA